MVRRGPTPGAVPLALMLGQAALPLAASPAGSRGGAGASAGAAVNYATARLERRLMAVRASGPITLDGLPDEAAWNDAPIASHFLQNDPREGGPARSTPKCASSTTTTRSISGYSPKTMNRRLIVNDLKKDFDTESSDGFRIVLDTFHDARNGYTFATNPAGARMRRADGKRRTRKKRGLGRDLGRRDTHQRNRVVRRNPRSVPYALKFEGRDIQTWGVNFERKVRRLNEDSYWSPLPRIYNLDRVSMAGTVEGLTGLRPGMNLRFKPCAATTSTPSRAHERPASWTRGSM